MREMKKKITLAVFVLVFSMLFPHLAINNTVSLSSPITTIHVQTKTVPVCTSFDIDITVTDVKNLDSFIINLSYNATILQYLEAKNGNFWSGVGGNFRASNDTIGELKMQGGFPSEPATGSGTLATITFHCTGPGECNLVLHDTELSNSSSKIPHDKEHGKCTQADILNEALHIDKNYTLCTDMYSNGTDLFIIDVNNIVVDLNGYTLRDLSNVGVAVQVAGRSNVCIMNGTVMSFQKGFVIKNKSRDVKIVNTTVLFSKVTAVEIRDCSNIQISKNEFSGSALDEAIFLDSSSLVNITDNTISGSFDGIYMTSSNYNNISKNIISDNVDKGIYMSSSFHNNIWNNDFIKNKRRHAVSSDSVNNWNLSYPHGGNYWDDYRSQSINDNFSGKNHTIPIPGPDGIGDRPYTIDKDNQDEYPLMNPHGSMLQVCDICKVLVPLKGENETRTLSVAVFTDSSVADFNFDGTLGLISFNVSGQCTFCKVIVSRELLDGVFEIKIDSIPVASFLNWDGDYVFANFTYSSGRRQVEVCGEIVRRCDLNSDGKVNILDLALVAKEFGSTYIYENP